VSTRHLLVALALACAATPAAAVPRSAWPFRTEAVPVAPAPDDTIEVTATVPYLGSFGHGRAYVALAPGHAALENPIVVIEGFDIDNAMGWDELYDQLNQESLLEELRTRGYDAVVLDFADATDYIQRNAFVFTALLEQVESAIPPDRTVAVVGASMGGLVGRYGLAWLEAQGQPRRVRTFLSYDAPQRGANIPLGLQYWVDFFAGQSADAAYFRDRLNTPAARQMLAYHFTSPPSSTPTADPLHAQLDADLAAVGGYPTGMRRVAFSNGSGAGQDQGYAPGAQLIQYSYSNFAVLLLGNVWAVPNGGPGTVFDGRIKITFISDTKRTVTVSGALPFDSAPGGWRASLAQLDTTQAPYGDIVALHDAHCFVPTISALDVPTTDLFATSFVGSPFDAVYTAPSNEEHVHISATEAAELLAELDVPLVAVSDPPAAPRLSFVSAAPNPGAGVVRLTFATPLAGPCDARVISASGRAVRTLRADGGAGTRILTWDGRDNHGTLVPAGLYFVRIAQGASTTFGRVVRVSL
jgi:hypothetical protein